MIKFTANFQENDEHLKKGLAAIKELDRLNVLVGIPESESSRDSEINNAELLYIHTNGSPLGTENGGGIPPRPVIEPAITDGKEQLGELLKEASKKALDGNIDGMRQGLEKTGMHAMNISHAWFTNPKNNWQHLKAEAVRQREKKMSTKKLAEAEEQNKPHMPLIDTGELRKSITYVVKER